jgi:anti-anti-sigma factor
MQIDPAEDGGQLLAVWTVTDGRRTLCVSGELDLATAPQLEHALEGMIEPGIDVTFEVNDLRFMDAAGLNVLVGVRRSVGRPGRVSLRHPGTIVRRVISVAGLDGAEGFEQAPTIVPT